MGGATISQHSCESGRYDARRDHGRGTSHVRTASCCANSRSRWNWKTGYPPNHRGIGTPLGHRFDEGEMWVEAGTRVEGRTYEPVVAKESQEMRGMALLAASRHARRCRRQRQQPTAGQHAMQPEQRRKLHKRGDATEAATLAPFALVSARDLDGRDPH